MLHLFTLFNAVTAETPCDKPVRIQMAQVQDATESFKNDVDYMKKFMTKLTTSLADEYGALDFAMAAFTDKPQVATGSGPNQGVWRNYASNDVVDFCYKRVTPLSPDTDMKDMVIGGGKDDHENQLDALAMAAMDPEMNWVVEDEDADGNVLVRLAVLVTDAGAHRASGRDTSEENRNWYHEELFYGPCNYKEEGCDGFFGFGSSRSGVALSLTGVLAHYNAFKMGNDVEMLTHSEFVGSPNWKLLEEYKYCCTEIFDQDPISWYNSCDHYHDWATCAETSCKRCTGKGCADVCAGKENDEVEWMSNIDLPDITVSPYVYGEARFDDSLDCSTMEYPDPFSQEYADLFKINDVTPVFFIRLPSSKPDLLTPSWPFDFPSLFMANQTCPVVGQRLAKYWLCYSNDGWQRDGGISQNGGCDNYDPTELSLETFYADCYQEHYGQVVEALNANGVKAYMQVIDSTVKADDLVDKLKAYVDQVVDDHPSCHTTTTEEVPITMASLQTPATHATKPAPVTTPVTPGPSDSSNSDAEDSTSGGAGGSTGVIVGSAAGGISAIGAAAALWAKGMIPGMSSAPVDAHIEEANIHNDTMEREQMTEVSANMFL